MSANDPLFGLVCVCAAGLSANCQATCVNTVGSFECSCNGPEFTLDPATAECVSKSFWGPSFHMASQALPVMLFGKMYYSYSV